MIKNKHSETATFPSQKPTTMPPAAAAPAYNTDLRAPIEVTVSDRPCTKGHGR